MTPAKLLTVINDSGAPWEIHYRLGAASHSATLGDGSQRQFLATHFDDAGDWIELTKPVIISASSGIADYVQPSVFPPFTDGLWMLLGVICAIAFWNQANPLRRP